jgi:hypothetical protein
MSNHLLQSACFGLIGLSAACVSAPVNDNSLDVQLDQIVDLMPGDYFSKPD